MVGVAPAPVFCLELKKLTDAYTWAVSEYLRLQSAQMQAILNGEEGFEAEITEAAIRKDAAKYAIIGHRYEHGCMP